MCVCIREVGTSWASTLTLQDTNPQFFWATLVLNESGRQRGVEKDRESASERGGRFEEEGP